MKSVAWAYIHWTVGRAALVFGWQVPALAACCCLLPAHAQQGACFRVNMYFGIGRYQTEFGLGYWADVLLGFWIAGIVAVRPFCSDCECTVRSQHWLLVTCTSDSPYASKHCPQHNIWRPFCC